MATERRFKTQEDARRALAWVFREVEKDRMEPSKGRVLTYIALSISGILAEHDIEQRIQALEEAISKKGTTT
jgi:hypothetical protein